MKDKPLVSVIIPAYNCTSYISKAIDSALEQNVSLEVLVIDDCSKDNLDEVMKLYEDNPSVHYIKNEKNLGAANTRNRGIGLARGEYVAFLDADDYWEPDKLRKQIQVLVSSHTVLCATAREQMTVNGELTGHIIPIKRTITYKDLLKHNCISCSSVLMKTDVAKEFPMHHADSHEDYIMWLEIIKKYKYASGINEPLLKYRVSNQGKSGSKLKSAKMTFMVYRYMGFSVFKSIICFISYAVHGMWKHYIASK